MKFDFNNNILDEAFDFSGDDMETASEIDIVSDVRQGAKALRDPKPVAEKLLNVALPGFKRVYRADYDLCMIWKNTRSIRIGVANKIQRAKNYGAVKWQMIPMSSAEQLFLKYMLNRSKSVMYDLLDEDEVQRLSEEISLPQYMINEKANHFIDKRIGDYLTLDFYNRICAYAAEQHIVSNSLHISEDGGMFYWTCTTYQHNDTDFASHGEYSIVLGLTGEVDYPESYPAPKAKKEKNELDLMGTGLSRCAKKAFNTAFPKTVFKPKYMSDGRIAIFAPDKLDAQKYIDSVREHRSPAVTLSMSNILTPLRGIIRNGVKFDRPDDSQLVDDCLRAMNDVFPKDKYPDTDIVNMTYVPLKNNEGVRVPIIAFIPFDVNTGACELVIMPIDKRCKFTKAGEYYIEGELNG